MEQFCHDLGMNGSIPAGGASRRSLNERRRALLWFRARGRGGCPSGESPRPATALRATLGALALTLALGGLQAQDPAFTQFPALPMLWNPAFAGYGQGTEITAVFRDQWPSAPQAYVTYGAAVSHSAPALQSGFGALVLGDRQGDGAFNTHRLLGAYAFAVPLGRRGAIRAGLSAEVAQRALRWDQLRFFDQIDPVYGFSDAAGVPNPTAQVPPGRNGLWWFDAHAGVLVHSRTLYAGLSVLHLPAPNTAFYEGATDRVPRAFSAQAGARLPLGRPDRELPNVFAPRVVYHQQGPFRQAQATLRFGLGPLVAGAGFRHAFGNADAFLAEAGWRQAAFSAVYSYDAAVGPAAGISGGAHEISLGWRLGTDAPRERRIRLGESLECPVF
jgi:type IX secretion system PorP/SprF family membrane protein